jgi:TPR repeat protein
VFLPARCQRVQGRQTNEGLDGRALKYETGDVVPQDNIEALKWYILAAKTFRVAGDSRDRLAREMTEAEFIEAQRRAAEWKPNPERDLPARSLEVPGKP